MAEQPEGLRKDGEWVVVSLVPDVCLTPIGPAMVPVPYPIVAFGRDAADVASTVRMTGLEAFTRSSCVLRVYGDEAGVGGGVKSKVNTGLAYWATSSQTVRAQGQLVLRDGDLFYMNAAGKIFNTLGKAIWVIGVKIVRDVPKGIMAGIRDDINDWTKEWPENFGEGAMAGTPGGPVLGGVANVLVQDVQETADTLADYALKGQDAELIGYTIEQSFLMGAIGKIVRKVGKPLLNTVRIMRKQRALAQKVAKARKAMDAARKARRRLKPK